MVTLTSVESVLKRKNKDFKMIPHPTESNLEHFERISQVDMGNYFAAEFLAVHRAIDTLKRSDGKPMRYADWMRDAVGFVENLEAGIGVKYRDLSIGLEAIAERGLVKVSGDLNKLFSLADDCWVQITPKGYLATHKEWWTEEDYLHVKMNSEWEE